MIKVKKNLVFIIFFFLLTTNLYSSDKVAFINMDLVIKKSEIGIKMLEKIENLNNKNISSLKTKQSELKAFEDEIKKKQNIISSEEINKEIEILKKKIQEYNDEKDILVNQFNSYKKKELESIMRKINPIVQNYMKKNSIEILLDSKNVYIGDKNSDLTEIIINEINANN